MGEDLGLDSHEAGAMFLDSRNPRGDERFGKIVTRPKGAAPWSFKLHVSTGALITVDRHPAHGFTWSVRDMPVR